MKNQLIRWNNRLLNENFIYQPIDLVVECSEDRGSIPVRVIPKTQKWYLILPCLTLSIIRYISRVKWSSPGKGVAAIEKESL